LTFFSPQMPERLLCISWDLVYLLPRIFISPTTIWKLKTLNPLKERQLATFLWPHKLLTLVNVVNRNWLDKLKLCKLVIIVIEEFWKPLELELYSFNIGWNPLWPLLRSKPAELLFIPIRNILMYNPVVFYGREENTQIWLTNN